MKSKKDERLKNIIKIRDGVYEIQISNGTRDDGKRDRITQTVYGTEEDAISTRDKLKEELKLKKSKGLNTSNSGYTFLDVAKKFLNDKDYGKRIGTTLKGYKGYLNNYIIPEIGFKKIRNIKESDLKALYDKMKKTKARNSNNFLSGTTIKHCHTLIGTIFNYAIFNKMTLYNPAEYVINPPTFDTEEREYYDHEEIALALNYLNKLPEHKNGVSDKMLHFQNIRFKTAITILFNSGLRRGELFGLKWKDIKNKTCVFKIKRAIATIDAEEFDEEDIIEVLPNGLLCKKLKNDYSRRDILMPTLCFSLLEEYKQNQINCGFSVTDEDYIFKNLRNNCVWNPNNLTREWSLFIEKFHLKSIDIHDIRHSHATDLLSMGVPIQDVSRRLGHSDISTTLKIYVHSNLGQDRHIVDLLENQYVSKVLNTKVVLSFIIGKNLVSEEQIKEAVKYITGISINENNRLKLLSVCKNYVLDEYDYLKNVTTFIDSNSNDNIIDSFVGLLNNMKLDVFKIRPINFKDTFRYE